MRTQATVANAKWVGAYACVCLCMCQPCVHVCMCASHSAGPSSPATRSRLRPGPKIVYGPPSNWHRHHHTVYTTNTHNQRAFYRPCKNIVSIRGRTRSDAVGRHVHDVHGLALCNGHTTLASRSAAAGHWHPVNAPLARANIVHLLADSAAPKWSKHLATLGKSHSAKRQQPVNRPFAIRRNCKNKYTSHCRHPPAQKAFGPAARSVAPSRTAARTGHVRRGKRTPTKPVSPPTQGYLRAAITDGRKGAGARN